MTQTQRNEIKRKWFQDADAIREIPMPHNAKFFVGQEVVLDDRILEVVGYYDYFGKWPLFLMLDLEDNTPCGIPFTRLDDMYLKSEAHKQHCARIIRVNFTKQIKT